MKDENTLNDLNNKVKATDEEKASLLTAKRLLHSNRNTCFDISNYQNTLAKAQKKNQRNKKSRTITTNPNAVTSLNQFAPLATEELDEV